MSFKSPKKNSQQSSAASLCNFTYASRITQNTAKKTHYSEKNKTQKKQDDDDFQSEISRDFVNSNEDFPALPVSVQNSCWELSSPWVSKQRNKSPEVDSLTSNWRDALVSLKKSDSIDSSLISGKKHSILTNSLSEKASKDELRTRQNNSFIPYDTWDKPAGRHRHHGKSRAFNKSMSDSKEFDTLYRKVPDSWLDGECNSPRMKHEADRSLGRTDFFYAKSDETHSKKNDKKYLMQSSSDDNDTLSSRLPNRFSENNVNSSIFQKKERSQSTFHDWDTLRMKMSSKNSRPKTEIVACSPSGNKKKPVSVQFSTGQGPLNYDSDTKGEQNGSTMWKLQSNQKLKARSFNLRSEQTRSDARDSMKNKNLHRASDCNDNSKSKEPSNADSASAGHKKKFKKRLSKIKRHAALYSSKIAVIPAEVNMKLAGITSGESNQKNTFSPIVDVSSASEFPELIPSSYANKLVSKKSLSVISSELSGEAAEKSYEKSSVTDDTLAEGGDVEQKKTKSVKIKFLSGFLPEGSCLEVDANSVNMQEKKEKVQDSSSSMAVKKKENSKVKPCPRDPVLLFDLLASSSSKQKEKKKKNEIENKTVSKQSIERKVLNFLDSSSPAVKRGKEREKPKQKRPSHLKKIILKEREQRKEKINLLKAAEQYFQAHSSVSAFSEMIDSHWILKSGSEKPGAALSTSFSAQIPDEQRFTQTLPSLPGGAVSNSNISELKLQTLSSIDAISNYALELVKSCIESAMKELEGCMEKRNMPSGLDSLIPVVGLCDNRGDHKLVDNIYSDANVKCSVLNSSGSSMRSGIFVKETEERSRNIPVNGSVFIPRCTSVECSDDNIDSVVTETLQSNNFENFELPDNPLGISGGNKQANIFAELEALWGIHQSLTTENSVLQVQHSVNRSVHTIDNYEPLAGIENRQDSSVNDGNQNGNIKGGGGESLPEAPKKVQLWHEISLNSCGVCKDQFMKISYSTEHNTNPSSVSVLPQELDNGKIREEDRRKAVKIVMHTRNFREYCNQLLSKKLDEAVQSLLEDLTRFQDRMHQKDPVKARMKRRLVYGIKEVTKHLKLKKLKCVVIAPNVENIQTEGGLNDALGNLIRVAGEYHVPCIFALERKQLGKLCRKPVPVSCVGVFNYEGSEVSFKTLLELHEESTKDYLELHNIILENIHEKDVLQLLHASEKAPSTLLGCRATVVRSAMMKGSSKLELTPECEKFIAKYMIKI